MVRRLTLLCHAATEAQRRGAFPRPEDIIAREPSTASPQLRADRVFSAPEKRAQQTAALLNLPFTIDESLRDCDFGTWTGDSLGAIFERDPTGAQQWLSDPAAKPHGGESIAELLARTAGWLASLQEPGHTIAVTHASVMRAAALDILRAPPDSFWKIDIEPLAIIDLRHGGKHWSIRGIGRPVRRSGRLYTEFPTTYDLAAP